MKFNILKDSILNIVAITIFTITTQLLIYPFLSSVLSNNEFGTTLTLMGIINAIGVIFGGSLNNIKLLLDQEYKKRIVKNNTGDFLLLLLLSIFITVVILIIVILAFKKQLILCNGILLILTSILIMLRSYLTVYYRLDINYKQILIHMMVTSIGYIIGLLVYKVCLYWSVIFFVGEFVSLVYLTFSIPKISSILNSFPPEITPLFNITCTNYIQLIGANSISNIMLYLDRILLNPLLGPSNVAVFFSASLFGKMLGLVLQPMSGVILTYISHDISLTKKKIFNISIVLSFSMAIFVYVFSVFLSPVFIRIFYPALYEEALKIYNLSNLSSIVLIVGNLIQPIILRFGKIHWQLLSQMIYAICYLGLGILLTVYFGIKGFVLGVLIANCIRLAMFLFLGIISTKEKESDVKS